MGYNCAHVIIGDQSEGRFLTLGNIGDIMTSNMHRQCLHEPSLDIFNLGVHRRLFSDISPMVFGVETSGENFHACIEIFLDVPMPWRSMAITHVRR